MNAKGCLFRTMCYFECNAQIEIAPRLAFGTQRNRAAFDRNKKFSIDFAHECPMNCFKFSH